MSSGASADANPGLLLEAPPRGRVPGGENFAFCYICSTGTAPRPQNFAFCYICINARCPAGRVARPLRGQRMGFEVCGVRFLARTGDVRDLRLRGAFRPDDTFNQAKASQRTGLIPSPKNPSPPTAEIWIDKLWGAPPVATWPAPQQPLQAAAPLAGASPHAFLQTHAPPSAPATAPGPSSSGSRVYHEALTKHIQHPQENLLRRGRACYQ